MCVLQKQEEATITLFNPHNNPMRWYYYYSVLTAWETEAQGNKYCIQLVEEWGSVHNQR